MSEIPSSGIPGKEILDYASPMVKGPLRLAIRSILTFVPHPDGLRIVETLEGRIQAVAAISFCSVTMTTLGSAISGCSPRLSATWIFSMSLFAIVALGVLTLIAVVINSSWQKTVLQLGVDYLYLRFSSPFKAQPWQWGWAQVVDSRVFQKLDPKTQRIIYELHIELSPPALVKLFVGHGVPELSLIAEHIRARIQLVPELPADLPT